MRARRSKLCTLHVNETCVNSRRVVSRSGSRRRSSRPDAAAVSHSLWGNISV